MVEKIQETKVHSYPFSNMTMSCRIAQRAQESASTLSSSNKESKSCIEKIVESIKNLIGRIFTFMFSCCVKKEAESKSEFKAVREPSPDPLETEEYDLVGEASGDNSPEVVE